MDGGIDDALALILALRSPELDVVGITAVSGNVPVEQAATNALRVVELLDRRGIWVAGGLANPLVRDPIRATDFHGKDGLGDSNLPQPKLRPRGESALTLIKEEVQNARRGELSVIATGPLTNIAAVITEDPEIAQRLGEVVIMGGAFGLTEYGIGNETPVAEFNIFSDPEAAKIVFDSQTPLKAVGLDVTTAPRAHLSLADYRRLKARRTKTADFASRILENAMKRWRRFALHDPIAAAVKVRPSLFSFVSTHVTIETRGEYTTGMTVSDRRDWLPEASRVRLKVKVCEKVEYSGFRKLFFKTIL